MSGHAKIGPDIAKVWSVKQYMAKIWVGKPKYGEIVPIHAKIWSSLPCYAQRYCQYGQVMVKNTRI